MDKVSKFSNLPQHNSLSIDLFNECRTFLDTNRDMIRDFKGRVATLEKEKYEEMLEWRSFKDEVKKSFEAIDHKIKDLEMEDNKNLVASRKRLRTQVDQIPKLPKPKQQQKLYDLSEIKRIDTELGFMRGEIIKIKQELNFPKKVNENSKGTYTPRNGSLSRQSSKSPFTRKESISGRSQTPVKQKGLVRKRQPHFEQRKPYLKHVYSSGSGPDAELIERIQKEVITFRPTIGFKDIAQLETAKNLLYEAVIMPLQFPDLFEGELRRPWKGILLFGPPGTGKTLLAKAIASLGQTTFFNVTASTLASKWRGDSQKLVRILFQMAEYYAPTTIFIDEIDSLTSQRGQNENEASRRVKTELMARIDGATSDPLKRLVIIGATNRPWDLDEAIRRRMEKRIHIPLPTSIGRKTLLDIALAKQDADVVSKLDLEEIVRRTENYSGADLWNVCREAVRGKLRLRINYKEMVSETQREEFKREARRLSSEDFWRAIRDVRPSVGLGELGRYQQWQSDYGLRGGD